jgi:glyoxylase-like metal-dependent hydrolase (beta-lactamase superfamily II)
MPTRLFALTCGWLTGPMEGFLAGETGRLRVPVPCFLIDHPKGKVLFDAGLHPDVARDPAARLGFAATLFQSEFGADDDAASRLAAVGVDAGDIRFLIVSHLHFDHAGGIATIPNARLVVQEREWAAGCDADLAQRNFYDAKDYDTGHDVLRVNGEHDLFGDGSVVCLPTFGHTPGHQSLRVRLDDGAVVLTADACYLRRTLEEMHLPGVAFDHEAMLASLRAIRAWRDRGDSIVYGHDPDLWVTVPQAPNELAPHRRTDI